ncbi:MAG: glycosyltransferase family 4 protein [Actinobacteria bacterium]|nr:glycosyltransferase family 4 protein [Actinomycetota bacterium]
MPATSHEAHEVMVNLLWCVPGKVGGSEEYLVRQLLGLAEQPEQPGRRWNATAFVARGLAAAHPELSPAVRMVEPTFHSRSRARRIIGEATWLRRACVDASLVHHGGGTAPLRARRPYVLTVHDLQFRTYPQYFSRLKRAYLSSAIPRSVHGAAIVTVPSEYVRECVIKAYNAEPAKVMLVPHGIEPALSADVTPESELRELYQLGEGPIVVYPAVTHPHKNHRFLLTLLAQRWTEPDLRLVLIGGVGSAEHVVASADDRRVLRLGRVSAGHRNGLIAMADAMVFPSEYEGFGAPLIEAMTLGSPVICSDATCMPEVVGGAGLVLPLQLDAWAGALDEARTRRVQLVAAGRRRALAFSSFASGAALAAAYSKAVAQ